MTIAQLDKYIDDNLTVSDKDIKFNLKRLLVVNRGASLSDQFINYIKTIKLKKLFKRKPINQLRLSP